MEGKEEKYLTPQPPLMKLIYELLILYSVVDPRFGQIQIKGSVSRTRNVIKYTIELVF